MSVNTETVRFIPTTGEDIWTVEVHARDSVRTIGRVAKYSSGWQGLAVGARAWTGMLPTRALAVRDIRLGITFQTAYLR